MMKMVKSSVTYAHAHTTNDVRALPKTSDARRSCISILGNPKHFRSFTGNIFNSKSPSSRLCAFSDVVSKSTPPVPQSEQDAEWAIILYTPPSEFFLAVALNCTETIVEFEKSLVDLVLLCPIPPEWTFKAPSYVVPWPLSMPILTQEVQPCPIPNKLQIIVCVPTLCLVVVALNLEVSCKGTVIATNAPECVLTYAPSSGDASPVSSYGRAEDALQLALGQEGEMDVDMTQLLSQFHLEVRPDFSCAGAKGGGGGHMAGAHASCDSCAPSLYSYLSDEPPADDLNTHSSGSEGGQCATSAPRIVASTAPSSNARSVEMRPENRPRTFAEVVSRGIAPCAPVTAFNPAKIAHTTMVAQGGRAAGAAAAVAPKSVRSATTCPRSWADVVKAVPM